MARAITSDFIPVRVEVRKRPDLSERFGVAWTPTQIVIDPDGVERHRIEGFLPIDDLLAQLEMGLARVSLEKKDYEEAEERFRRVCERFPATGAAPEACYWAGVAAYKRTDDSYHLMRAAEELVRRYPVTEWARKASIWAPKHEPHAA